MSQFYNDSIFWIDVDKIKPNPFQPRRDFDPAQLQSLSDSIRQYGVLQALVVTRKEVQKDDGGLAVEYELIAGERRLRASKLAGLSQVPVLIKVGDEVEGNDLMKLELAIIENVQREDLNPVDRARAFDRLVSEFNFKHADIAHKIGKSRVYITNTLRILDLPQEILDAISSGKIFEGHTRPLLALSTRPEEQATLFKEIMFKKLTVREAEAIARRIAYEKARKKDALLDPETQELEEALTESLGTRVLIEKRENGGKITIDFFSDDDLKNILELIKNNQGAPVVEAPDVDAALAEKIIEAAGEKTAENPSVESIPSEALADGDVIVEIDDRSPEEIKTAEDTDPDTDTDLYSIKNFSI